MNLNIHTYITSSRFGTFSYPTTHLVRINTAITDIFEPTHLPSHFADIIYGWSPSVKSLILESAKSTLRITKARFGHFCPFITVLLYYLYAKTTVEMSCFNFLIQVSKSFARIMKIDEYLPRFYLIKISFHVHFLACTIYPYPTVPLRFIIICNSTETSLTI